METNKLYRKAIATFGEEKQCIVAIEELSELQKELTKFLRKKLDQGHLEEEIADVKIVVEQLIMIFRCKEEVEGWRQRKLERLEKKLEETCHEG